MTKTLSEQRRDQAIARNLQLNTERREDLEWMAYGGESVAGAAERLGILPKTLETWCSRHDADDLYDRLRANERCSGAGARAGRLTTGAA